MTFLFDEQLSEKLCDLLADVYPSSRHVRIIGLPSEILDMKLGGFTNERQGFILWHQAPRHRPLGTHRHPYAPYAP